VIDWSEKDRRQIVALLREMHNPVKLVYFTRELDCELCSETRRLLEALVALCDKLSLEVYNLQLDKEKVAQYGVDKVPATVVEGAKDYGIRFYGLPAGYEFVVLLEDIVRISLGNSGLSQETLERLRQLSGPVHLEVFATPTCPYCPGAVRLAHQLAIESELITADMVEATEFPDLVRRHKVRGVPKTVINGTSGIEGSLPESDLVERILTSAAAARESAAPSPVSA
jgi:glutaredoxin-like protein